MPPYGLFGQRRSDHQWEFCGITPHDEVAYEFEEQLLDPNSKYEAISCPDIEDEATIANYIMNPDSIIRRPRLRGPIED